MLIVKKFGGSSVANAERIKHVAETIVKSYREGNRVVVVLSAQGDTTDELIEKAAEINPHASKREMDMLLSTGEQQSVALMAMAIAQRLSVQDIFHIHPRQRKDKGYIHGEDNKRAREKEHRYNNGLPGLQQTP